MPETINIMPCGRTTEAAVMDDCIRRAMGDCAQAVGYRVGDREFAEMVRRLRLPIQRVGGRVFIDYDFGTTTARVYANGLTQPWHIIEVEESNDAV